MSVARLIAPFRRRDVRVARGIQQIEGLWQSADSEDLKPIVVTDISPDGFGIVLEKPLPVGSEISAVFSMPFVLTVSAQVVWCEPGLDGAYRAGLCCDADGNRRLDSIYRKVICGD